MKGSAMFKRLSSCVPGERVSFASVHSDEAWTVLETRNLKQRPLHPKTYRLRPENVRSRFSAIIQNESTGRIRTVYFADKVKMRPAKMMPTIALVACVMGLSGIAGYAVS